MKSYLSLIPVSAKIHRRKNRMTLFCIIISVFLVTAVFSMADMGYRMEKENLVKKHGNWSVCLYHMKQEDAELIGLQANVSSTAWYSVINSEIDESYYLNDKMAILYGVEKGYLEEMVNYQVEGDFPGNNSEIMLTQNAKEVLEVGIGDKVTVSTPSGEIGYTVSGFCEDDGSALLADAIGVYMGQAAFNNICTINNRKENPKYYIRFQKGIHVREAITEIKGKYHLKDKDVEENKGVLGMEGYGGSAMFSSLYAVAAILFVLILLAGVFMIAGSLNSDIAERSRFFGMMRCIGASRKQIRCFVRLEALNWCKIAVPAGIIPGIVVTWGLCAVMRLVSAEFSEIPVFGISIIGIIFGMVVGILTVLLAAQSPVKRASKVSPAAAVSGNSGNMEKVRHAADVRFSKVETALGIHHAVSAKKNLILMVCSFALSIVMFLSFSAILDFAKSLLPSIRPYEPDFVVVANGKPMIGKDFIEEVGRQDGIKRVYGNMCSSKVPVESDKKIGKARIVSYDEYMLQCAEDEIISGDISKVRTSKGHVMTIFNKNNPLEVGDKVRLEGKEVEVAAVLSEGLFADEVTLIGTEDTFTWLTGENQYSIVQVQFQKDVAAKDIRALRNLADGKYAVTDQRQINQESNATFWMVRLLVYGFLLIVAMITVFYIINSISMNVSARIKQYGAMRAIGMSMQQLTKMIAAEALTYAVCGCAVGCIAGLPLHYLIIHKLVTKYNGVSWNIPVVAIAVILLIVSASAVVAVCVPAKRMEKMEIVDTINEL